MGFIEKLRVIVSKSSEKTPPSFIGSLSNETVKKALSTVPPSVFEPGVMEQTTEQQQRLREIVHQHGGGRVDEQHEYLVNKRDARADFGRRGR